jgi:hypothetical protein
VGDGVTDDTVAIQAALDALTPNSTLIIKGDFYVDQNVYLKDVDNVTIDCTGANITWGSQNFILFETCDNVTLKNIQYAICNAPAVASNNRPTGTTVPAAFWTFGIVAYCCQNFTFVNNHVDFNNTLLCVAGGAGHNVSGNKVFHGKDNTIYFFSHTPIERSKSGFDMYYWNIEFGCHKRACKRGVGITVHQHRVGFLRHGHSFECYHHASRHLSMPPSIYGKAMGRSRNFEFFKENI